MGRAIGGLVVFLVIGGIGVGMMLYGATLAGAGVVAAGAVIGLGIAKK